MLHLHKFINMKAILYLTVTIFCLSLAGCASGDKKDILKQAYTVHLEAVAIAEDLEKTLLSLRQKHQDSVSVVEIDSLNKLIRLWEEAVVEVPGFEHQHGRAGHHDHKPAPQMTEQSMLDYQIRAREAIISVKTQVNALEKKHEQP